MTRYKEQYHKIQSLYMTEGNRQIAIVFYNDVNMKFNSEDIELLKLNGDILINNIEFK